MSNSHTFLKSIQVRWSDLDPNYHVMHSVYYDYGAYCRIAFFYAHGLTAAVFNQNHFGPILLREECVFRREIRLDDLVTIDLQLVKAKPDCSRWTIQHVIARNNDYAAAITMDGAWIDTTQRKLTIPPELARATFSKMPRTEGFEWIK